MHRLITLVLMGFLVMSGWALVADEQNTQELTANGSRTTQPFTVKDHCEVRWTSTNDLSLFLLDAQGGLVEELGYSTGDASDAMYHANGGTYSFSLKISSSAHWIITVVQLP